MFGWHCQEVLLSSISPDKNVDEVIVSASECQAPGVNYPKAGLTKLHRLSIAWRQASPRASAMDFMPTAPVVVPEPHQYEKHLPSERHAYNVECIRGIRHAHSLVKASSYAG